MFSLPEIDIQIALRFPDQSLPRLSLTAEKSGDGSFREILGGKAVGQYHELGHRGSTWRIHRCQHDLRNLAAFDLGDDIRKGENKRTRRDPAAFKHLTEDKKSFQILVAGHQTIHLFIDQLALDRHHRRGDL